MARLYSKHADTRAKLDPMEVEGLLLAHPDICQTAVVGCADETFGEIAVAYVQLEPGIQMSADAVIAHCRGKVARADSHHSGS